MHKHTHEKCSNKLRMKGLILILKNNNNKKSWAN